MTASPKLTRYLIIAAVLQVVWGFVPSASKFVIDEIPVELYIALRWTISGAIFALYLTFTKSWKPLALKDLAAIAGLGALGYGVASLGSLYGLKIGGVENFAMMSAAGPLITASVSMLILHEKPRKIFYLALPVSITGLLFLVAGKYSLSSVSIATTAAGCILGGAILEALTFVFSRRFKMRLTAVQYLALAQISAASLMWLLQGTWFHQTADLTHLTATGFGAALFVSLIACVLCYAVLYWLLDHIEGHRLALFEGFHALSATFFGWIFFHEPLTPLMLAGGFLILAGFVIGTLPKHQSL